MGHLALDPDRVQWLDLHRLIRFGLERDLLDRELLNRVVIDRGGLGRLRRRHVGTLCRAAVAVLVLLAAAAGSGVVAADLHKLLLRRAVR
ncbi:MAG TPA: hypothetical protein VFI42_08070 [Thermomicrobiaceae bacterium]|nr:hypothetical protein [Thermomicrobiaceae bacterium]